MMQQGSRSPCFMVRSRLLLFVVLAIALVCSMLFNIVYDALDFVVTSQAYHNSLIQGPADLQRVISQPGLLAKHVPSLR